MEADHFFFSWWVHNIDTKQLHKDYCLVTTDCTGLRKHECIVSSVKNLVASSSSHNVNKHATHLNGDVSLTVKDKHG